MVQKWFESVSKVVKNGPKRLKMNRKWSINDLKMVQKGSKNGSEMVQIAHQKGSKNGYEMVQMVQK